MALLFTYNNGFLVTRIYMDTFSFDNLVRCAKGRNICLMMNMEIIDNRDHTGKFE